MIPASQDTSGRIELPYKNDGDARRAFQGVVQPQKVHNGSFWGTL